MLSKAQGASESAVRSLRRQRRMDTSGPNKRTSSQGGIADV